MTYIAVALAVITLAVITFSLLKPARALSAYIITRPMIQPFIFLQHTVLGIPYAYIWGGMLPVLYLVNLTLRRWVLVCHKMIPLFIILFLSAFSMAVSIDAVASVAGIVKIIAAIAAYGVAYNIVKDTESAENIIKAIVISSIVPLLFGFYQSITGEYDQLWESVTQRTNSVFGVGNGYGIYLSITMCALMILLLQKGMSKKTRLVYLAIFAGMAASQVLALNRGTWIALSGAIAVAIIPYRRKIKLRWFVAGGVLIAVFFSGTIIERFTVTTYRWDGTEADTFGDRINYWQQLLPQVMERPLLGHGIGTTGEIEGSRPPHNDYIRFAMDIGIPGALVYMYFLLSLALFYFRRIKYRRGNELWRYNFSMLVLTIYFIVISSTQNIAESPTNLGFFLVLNGMVVKLNMLKPAAKHSPRQVQRGLLAGVERR